VIQRPQTLVDDIQMTDKRLGRRGVVAGAGLALLSGGASAQRPPPALIPRRVLFAAPDRAKVRISPDGLRIAFLAPVNGVQNVWVAPLADVSAAKALTNIDDRDVAAELWWLHDSQHVIFFRDQAGDENWQAHCANVESGDIRALTPGPGVHAKMQQVSAQFPGEVLIAHNGRDKRYHDVYRIKAATGESELHYQNDRFAWTFTNPQFRVMFGARYRDDGGYELVIATGPDTGKVFRRVSAEDSATTRPIEASTDGRSLYWLDSEDRDRAALVVNDLSTGSLKLLIADKAADYGDPVLDPVSGKPLAIPVVYTRRRWEVVDPAFSPDLDLIRGSSEGDLGWFGMSNDRKNWVAYTEPPGAPGRYIHFSRETRRIRRLFSTRPALDSAPLAPTQPVVVTARDGLKLVCYVTRPPELADREPGPLVMVVHGGPWTRDLPDYSTTHQWLANRGYNVMSVNFRGSTGFGKAFVNAGDREWGGRMHSDLLDAAEWAVRERVANTSQIAIYGASYGGYSALVGATLTPQRFACAVDLFGISNLVSFADDVPPYWKPWAPFLKARMGDASTEEGRKFLASRSPLTYADKIVRPLLIGQGGNDVRVTARESEQIVAAMQQRKIPVTYAYYKDEGHGFRRADNRRSWAAVVEAFLAQHLGGRAEPVGKDLEGSSLEFRAGRELITGL
jgi:dipeptidyl aminopeptidase/acylaminoacyl peptidase